MDSDKLAVVIPAYRAKYFAEALDSLVQQTNQYFRVYVGDDCSQEALREISDRYNDRLDISYRRFDDNIGAKDLVSQWNRCIEQVGDEHWLWVFSDDDVADPHCVERFYECLRLTGRAFDVYRFNTVVIDRDSKVIAVSPVGPLEESSAEMAYHLLLGRRGNSMPDHIFRRSKVQQNGGFIFTEYAQAADWASSIFFSSPTGIRIVEGATVRWRMSGHNISSIARKRNEMVGGHLQFIGWLLEHFQYLHTKPASISYQMMRDAALANLRSVAVWHYGGLRGRTNFKVFRFLRKTFRLTATQALKEIAFINVKSSPRLATMYRRARALTKH